MRKSYSSKEKDFLKKIGKRIRENRLATKLSQEQLAFKADLDRTYIGSIERGERNVSILNIQKISNALDISISELFKIKK